jgi:iron complex transport system substrate-binding protein
MLDEGDLKLDDVGDAAWVYAYRDGKPKPIVDSQDRVVTLYRPIERFVVTWRGQLEIPRSLKVEKDRVVGVEGYIQQGDFKIYFAEYQDKPAIGTVWTPDGEAIMGLHPDAVFIFPGSGFGPSNTLGVVADALESAGIAVIRVSGGTSDKEQAVKEVNMFGDVFDKESEAEELNDWYEGVVDSVTEKVESIPEEDRPKVYYEALFPYQTSRPDIVRIEKTGGKNIFKEMPYGVNVDPEKVATRNPDIIIISRLDIGGLGTDDTTEFEEIRNELMSREELRNVTAVKTGRVYVVTNYLESWYQGSGFRGGFIRDAYQAKWFSRQKHPKLFDDLDPKDIHQEYLTRFQGLDIDLDEKGVYVYHPEEHPDGN